MSSSLARGNKFTSLGKYSLNAKVITFKCARVYYEWNYTQQWCAMHYQGTTLINLRFKSWMKILKRDQFEWKLRVAFFFWYRLLGFKWFKLQVKPFCRYISELLWSSLAFSIPYLKLNLDAVWNCDPVCFGIIEVDKSILGEDILYHAWP